MSGTRGTFRSPFHDRLKKVQEKNQHEPEDKKISDNEFIKKWFLKGGRHFVGDKEV